MPRLRDRSVLDAGILDLPMIWQTDAFALAAGYDDAAGRYVGLWTPEDKESAPVATDSLLLVVPTSRGSSARTSPAMRFLPPPSQARALRPRCLTGDSTSAFPTSCAAEAMLG